MTDAAAPVVELRLLTHRPEAAVAWWAALLGGAPQSLTARTTAIAGAHLRVVIERSQIALDYHPEASGVTAIGLGLGDAAVVQETLNRLARLESEPHRATRQGGVIALWFHDPNGVDVTLCWPTTIARRTPAIDAWPEELDVQAVLDDVYGHQNSVTVSETGGP